MLGNYTSVYFRHGFVIDDLAKASDLVLDILMDDGFKVWINGINLISFNLGNRETPFNATASSSFEFSSFLSIPLAQAGFFLHKGTNLVAVQVHNASLSNNDFYFDLALRSQPGVNPIGATPGVKNTAAADNVPPQVRPG